MFKKYKVIGCLLFTLFFAAENSAQIDTLNQPSKTTQPIKPDTTMNHPVHPDTSMYKPVRPDTTRKSGYPDTLNYLGDAYNICEHNCNEIITYSILNNVNMFPGREYLFIRRKMISGNSEKFRFS